MKNLIITSLLNIAFAGTLSAQNADSSKFYYQKGIEEKNARHYLVASGYFSKAIAFNPRFVDAYIEDGLVNTEMRRTDVAKASFAKAFELDPENETAVKELTTLYFNYRQYQEALDLAQKCRKCNNKDRIIALSYFYMEDYGNAEKLLLSLANKNPNDAEIIHTLAKNYVAMGLENKAIPWYEKAVVLDNKNRWYFELGVLYAGSGNYKSAVTAYTKAAELGYFRNNDFNESLGYAYIYSGDFENGDKLMSELVRKKPGDKELKREVATAFYESKNYDKALEYCQMLLEMDMKDGRALYQAGLCFQKKGMVERGMQMCDKAIELDPSLAELKSKKQMAGL